VRHFGRRINAASMAAAADDFGAGVDGLVRVWENFSAHQVYRADPAGIGLSGARWLSTLALGWLTRRAPRSLLDNAPLRGLLESSLDFSRIGRPSKAGPCIRSASPAPAIRPARA
jgi:NTE family protein